MPRLRDAIDELRTNPEQWEAFTHEGHCVVLAPPGSGKTKLLTTKAVWLANNALQPSQGIACITLTNPAAGEIRSRIRHLGQPIGRSVSVGTVHSFAWSQIVRPFAAPAGHSEWLGYALAPRAATTTAMNEAIRSVYGPNAETRYVDSTVKRNRRMCLPEDGWKMTGPDVRKVALEYERLLREQDLVDFDDIVAMAVQLVEENSFVRTVLHARRPYLLVDEYQDLAPGLHRIVKAVSLEGGSSTLFAVGDPDQAIFGWTGTRPELLVDLSAHEAVRRIDLRINYRCGARIAAASRRILAAAGDEPVTVRDGGSVAVRCEPNGFEAQAQYVANRIIELQSAGTPLHEIAVLAPTNADCDELVTILREHDIPVLWRTDVYGQTPVTIALEALAAWTACGGEGTGYQLGDLLDQWIHLGNPTDLHGTTHEVVQVLLETSADDRAHSFVESLVEVMDRTGLTADARADDANELARMRSALGPGGSMEESTVHDLGRLRLRDGRVEVSTMVASKGLEFDHVFIVALEQGKIPFFNSAHGSAEWAEDRRKFYVSFTRARESVEVVYSGWYATPWGARKSNGPSVFLVEANLLAKS